MYHTSNVSEEFLRSILHVKNVEMNKKESKREWGDVAL